MLGRDPEPGVRRLIDTTIYVDADSCPVKEETYKVAKRYGLNVVLVAAQWLRIPAEPWLQLEVVKHDGQLDAADDWIAQRAGTADVVVTQDIVLASRCLENSARVISPRGRCFTPDSIGEALATRELMADLRETGEVSGGPPPFAKRDRSSYLQALDQTIQAIRRGR
jgi:uncharacterized protein